MNISEKMRFFYHVGRFEGNHEPIKLIFILSVLKNLDDRGRANIGDSLKFFRKYFATHAPKGWIPGFDYRIDDLPREPIQKTIEIVNVRAYNFLSNRSFFESPNSEDVQSYYKIPDCLWNALMPNDIEEMSKMIEDEMDKYYMRVKDDSEVSEEKEEVEEEEIPEKVLPVIIYEPKKIDGSGIRKTIDALSNEFAEIDKEIKRRHNSIFDITDDETVSKITNDSRKKMRILAHMRISLEKFKTSIYEASDEFDFNPSSEESSEDAEAEI